MFEQEERPDDVGAEGEQGVGGVDLRGGALGEEDPRCGECEVEVVAFLGEERRAGACGGSDGGFVCYRWKIGGSVVSLEKPRDGFCLD